MPYAGWGFRLVRWLTRALLSTMLRLAFRPALCCLVFASPSLFTGTAVAQRGAVTFKNFHQYPTGQWQQQAQTYRNGAPFGALISNTTCSGPGTPAQAEAIKQMANTAVSQCTMRVVTDTDRLAESEQICPIGGGTQIHHVTMRAVDDKSRTNEVRMTINGREMSVLRSTLHYQGTCTPAPVGAMPAMPKPSAEECKEMADMKQKAADGPKTCAELPTANRSSCEATF